MNVELRDVPKVFSRLTLEKFEDASASIVLRQIDRAFEGATIRLGKDPGGTIGDRRVQFRRYVASVDQHDPEQLERLGDALGALVAATSKEAFLVNAAESDGFSFADGVFRPARAAQHSLASALVEEPASIDERGRILHLLANENPREAIDRARELIESVCRTVLRFSDGPAPAKTAGLRDIATSTLAVLRLVPAGSGDEKKGAKLIRTCLQQLAAVVDDLGELQIGPGSGPGRDNSGNGLSPRHARLAVGAAVAFAGFVAESYREKAPPDDR